MKIELHSLDKLSLNAYMHYHWTKKKKFKDKIRLLLLSQNVKKLKGGYNINYEFTFKGNRLDTINVSHYCKIIEDFIFSQDKDNRQISINVKSGKENKCIIELIEL